MVFRWPFSVLILVKGDYAEQGLGLTFSAELPRLEWLYRLHVATNGVVGNVMNLLRQSAYTMELTGETALTLAILARSFEKRLCKHVGKANPFTESAFPAQPQAVPDPPDSTGHRSHRRQARKPTAADVLKTR